MEQTVQLIDELIAGQEKRLLKCGKRIVPTVTMEDLLQPNDYLELETHPEFRYEEGVLEGLRTVKAAMLAATPD